MLADFSAYSSENGRDSDGDTYDGAGSSPRRLCLHRKSGLCHAIPGSEPTVSLTETASTVLEPLFQIWASAYQKKFPNVKIVPSGEARARVSVTQAMA